MAFNIVRTRILTYINLVVLFLYFALNAIGFIRYLIIGGPVLDTLIFNFIAVGCVGGHNLLVIYIHRKLYPSKEISRTLRTLATIFTILSVAVVALLVLGLLGVFLVMNDDYFMEQYKSIIYIAIPAMALLIVLFTWQIIAGNNLVTHITGNYRRELENSIV